MQTADAIDRFQSLVLAGTKIEVKTDVPVAALPGLHGAVVIHELEQYMNLRSRFRGQMKTQSLTDFVKYVIDRKGSPTGFVNAESILALSATVIFNLGDTGQPGHADDTAVLELKRMAAFNAVLNVIKGSHSQRDLTDWIEDWNAQLSAYDPDGEPMTVVEAVAGLRAMNVSTSKSTTTNVASLSEARSSLESVEARSQLKTPAVIVMKTAPFDGFKDREIRLRLGMLTGGDKPQLVLRWMCQEADCEAIAQEFKEILSKDLGGLFPIYLGGFNKKP